MSGIAVIFHVDRRPAAAEAVSAMTGAMDYRGPDGIAHWVNGPVALGHCQLHTTAESCGTAQPLASADGRLVLAMDGFVLNHDELTRLLQERGIRLRDRSDAELVLQAWQAFGPDCTTRIDGEYAFVLWEADRQELFCARDHQGLRPLYYHFDGRTFIAASDIAAVLAALPQRPEPNLGFLAEVMTGYWLTQGETAWQGIGRLPPAHWCRIDASGVARHEYWTLPLGVTRPLRRDGEYIEEYRALHADLVRQCARSHRPVAFHVSGGLDSSSLYCMADVLLKKGDLPAPAVRGYTLAGAPGSIADEVAYARTVGRHTGTTITEAPLFSPELAWYNRRAAQDRDLPPFGNGAMSIGLERQAVADGCRVMINGIGGDQWLDGSHFYFHEQLRSLDLAGLVASTRDALASFGARQTRWLLLHYGISPWVTRRIKTAWRRIAGRSRAAPAGDWMRPEWREELARRRERYIASLPASPYLSHKVRKLRDPFLLGILDINSRQFARDGFEPRSPMLARRFMEFSATTPERLRLRGDTTKWYHRRAMAGILPPEIISRMDKADFAFASHAADRELKDYLLAGLPANLERICDSGTIADHIHSCCTAAVDEGASYELWGIYQSAWLMSGDSG